MSVFLGYDMLHVQRFVVSPVRVTVLLGQRRRHV